MRKRLKDIKMQKGMASQKRDYRYKSTQIENGVEESLRYFDDNQLFVSMDLREQLQDLKKEVQRNEELYRTAAKYQRSRVRLKASLLLASSQEDNKS